jgi:hypothetical protein
MIQEFLFHDDFAFALRSSRSTEETKEKWRLIDVPIREDVKKASGPKYSPIRYLIGVETQQGDYDYQSGEFYARVS